jgi:hypothetical protein
MIARASSIRPRVVELNQQGCCQRQRLDPFAWPDAREEIPYGLIELGGAGHWSFLCPLSYGALGGV